MGIATLIAGTVTVPNTIVTTNSRIMLTAQSLGTITVLAALAISARTPSVSFTILSSNLSEQVLLRGLYLNLLLNYIFM